MDEIDRGILKVLAANGRASFAFLGRQVKLSPNAVADRVRRLTEDGVITGVHAAIDPKAVGLPMMALIDLRLSGEMLPAEFERRATELTRVQEITFLTGRFDFQLRVVCEDAADLDRLVRELRASGAAETETRLVLKDTFRRTVGP